MNINKLTEPLKPEDIELRVGRITGYNGKFTMHLLAYKTSRIDVIRLNEAFGPLGWQCKYHYDTKDNLICSIGAYDQENSQWVYKEDVGTESNTEKEKGSHSDALKRACFRWGIGIELYKLKDLKCTIEEKDVREKDVQGKKIYSYKWSLSDWSLKYNHNGDPAIYDNFGKLRSAINNQSHNYKPTSTQNPVNDSSAMMAWLDTNLDVKKFCKDKEIGQNKAAAIFIKTGPSKHLFIDEAEKILNSELAKKADGLFNNNKEGIKNEPIN